MTHKWNARINATQTPDDAEREMHGQMVAALVIVAASAIGFVLFALFVALILTWLF